MPHASKNLAWVNVAVVVAILFSTVFASATYRDSFTSSCASPFNATIQQRWNNPGNCTLTKYFDPPPTPKDWRDRDKHGFAAAVGSWALGTPDFTCRYDGSSTNCDFLASCDHVRLNAIGEKDEDEMRFAYYLLESIRRLHAYCVGMREAFETATFNAAFSKEGWTQDFAKEDEDAIAELKKIFTMVSTILGVSTAFAGLAGPEASGAVGLVNAMFNGITSYVIQVEESNKVQEPLLKKASDLGHQLGKFALEMSKHYIEMNNVLMKGDDYLDSGDILDYLEGGLFVSYPGIDESKTIDAMNLLITARAINALYRTDRNYIIGGAPCGGGDGHIGRGAEFYWCDDNNAEWYAYRWHDHEGLDTGKALYGYITAPKGARDKLDEADYLGIRIEDVIRSSVLSYRAAGNTNQPRTDEIAKRLILDGSDPLHDGPGEAGIFTLPVCDISKAYKSKGGPDDPYHQERFILTRYSETEPLKERRPMYCGPVCDEDYDKTRFFIEAANMHGLDSYHHGCDGEGEETETYDGITDSGWSPDSPQEKEWDEKHKDD